MIDYRTLLKKYIHHVGESEGVDFIGCGRVKDGNFTQDEEGVLFELARELGAEVQAEYRRQNGLT